MCRFSKLTPAPPCAYIADVRRPIRNFAISTAGIAWYFFAPRRMGKSEFLEQDLIPVVSIPCAKSRDFGRYRRR
jgi:hypothetical protein